MRKQKLYIREIRIRIIDTDMHFGSEPRIVKDWYETQKTDADLLSAWNKKRPLGGSLEYQIQGRYVEVEEREVED